MRAPLWNRSVAPRAALAAGLTSILVGSLAALVLAPLTDAVGWPGHSALVIALTALVTAALVGLVTDRLVAKRVRYLETFLTREVRADGLRRLPGLGSDEVGRVAEAINQLLADVTNYRVNLIDQERTLAATQEELRLKAALAEKSTELEARLLERATLFEILRASASPVALDDLLKILVERLAPALRLREVGILIRDGEKRFVVRAVHGIAHREAVLGRSLAVGEGIAGLAAHAREPVVVADVTVEPRYLAFWGEAQREGSFAAAPIRHGEQLLGVLGLTRPPEDPLGLNDVRFIGAVADQIAMAIRHVQLVEELQLLSTHDELTGLANRRLLYSTLERELHRARRFDTPFSVAVLDIDFFKKLNDKSGHAAGDGALRGVAEILRKNVRAVDMVARVGGEEFVVLLPRTDLVEASAVAEKLRKRVERATLPGAGAQPGGRLTISVGVAQWTTSDTADSVIARADDALYLAKHRGRNRVAVQGDNRHAPVVH